VRALFLEHDHISPPGPIAERFSQHGYEIVETVVVPKESHSNPNIHFVFPDPNDFDVIVPMGSPWGVWDDPTIGNWLLPELEWLREADNQGVPVLGICFGGQLLARAHGGSVARAPQPEIGWSTVWSEVPELNGRWFQFHYDRWDTPTQAKEIARNSHATQAFSLRKNLALQFHPEITGSTLESWFNWGEDALVTANGQDPEILLAHTYALDSESIQRAHTLVDYFLHNFR
jgi:GMP synthase-like glutamine amidotransferase